MRWADLAAFESLTGPKGNLLEVYSSPDISWSNTSHLLNYKLPPSAILLAPYALRRTWNHSQICEKFRTLNGSQPNEWMLLPTAICVGLGTHASSTFIVQLHQCTIRLRFALYRDNERRTLMCYKAVGTYIHICKCLYIYTCKYSSKYWYTHSCKYWRAIKLYVLMYTTVSVSAKIWWESGRHTWDFTHFDVTQRACDTGEQEAPREEIIHDIEVAVLLEWDKREKLPARLTVDNQRLR